LRGAASGHDAIERVIIIITPLFELDVYMLFCSGSIYYARVGIVCTHALNEIAFYCFVIGGDRSVVCAL
jgi:hypothetical protein